MKTHIKETAICAARKAGALLRKRFWNPQYPGNLFDHDVKLPIDSLCEDIIRKIIKKEFPDHAILGEEKGWDSQAPLSDFVWIIDPLDGSINYYCGIPYFCVCVSCYRKHESGLLPLTGVVYAPMTDDIYVGHSGEVSFCNDKPIKPAGKSELSDIVAGVSFGSDEETMMKMDALIPLLSRKTRKIRILGSTALDMVNVARGKLGALIQGRVFLWDFAAARIILEGSGGIFNCTVQGQDTYQILACAPGVYDELNDMLSSLGWVSSNFDGLVKSRRLSCRT